MKMSNTAVPVVLEGKMNVAGYEKAHCRRCKGVGTVWIETSDYTCKECFGKGWKWYKEAL